MSIKDIFCEDEYEAQKLGSLIYIKDDNQTFINGILEIIDNEIIILLKDKSAHSILLSNKSQAEEFADFIQSILEGQDKITQTEILANIVKISKGRS